MKNMLKNTAIVSAFGVFGGLASFKAFAEERQLLWGDTHLHTKLSPDAYLMGNRSLMPDDAYRYAKGLPVVSAKTRHKIQIHTPLDFLVIADHAEYLGVIPRIFEGDPALAKTEPGRNLMDMIKAGKAREAFFELAASINRQKPYPEFITEKVKHTAWKEIYESADRHYEPGRFTSLIGWEWSSTSGGGNLHRIVFMSEGADVAKKFTPFSLFDGDRPEELWAWLERTEQRTGATFLAIPHNGNVSKGRMFAEVDSEGRPISAEYAKTRQRWEPIYEVTQIKGDGETTGVLSPDDEFSEFETYSHAMDARPGKDNALPSSKGSYARGALMRGLEIDLKTGVNPFRFGMIGSSDSHTGVSAVEEDRFGGKFSMDSYPEGKSLNLGGGLTGNDVSAAGLSAVWARENTREGIMEAFKRREVYGTTGPRIKLRVFGGWDFTVSDTGVIDLSKLGYAKGVPMGSELTLNSKLTKGKSRPLKLLIAASKDPNGANLDRVQVVKGWLDDKGVAHERVYNVAASDNRKIKDNKLSPVGNTVNVETASYTNDIGDAELVQVWTDPEFDNDRRAFYYVRVLQIPTPRHSLYASVALNQQHPTEYPSSIQERAYSSPIWYAP